jgi:hypothetical protein
VDQTVRTPFYQKPQDPSVMLKREETEKLPSKNAEVIEIERP